jgi:prepilin peptidase CpaA
MIVIYFIFIVCVLIASIYDATTQRIPNWSVLVIAISGLSWNYFSADGLSLRGSAAGLITGLILMLPGYVFASMGAGDVKFMAAIGSVVGFDSIINIAIYSYMAIFVMAIVFIIVKGDLLKLLLRYKALICGLLVGALHYQEPAKSDAASYQLPLAPAMALATFYVLYPALSNSGFMVNLWH